MTQKHEDGPLVLYACDTEGCNNQIEIDLMQGEIETHGWLSLPDRTGTKRLHICPNHMFSSSRTVRYIQPDTAPMSLPPDLINHPPHYTSHPSGVECLTIIKHMDYRLGCVVKYLWRGGLKDGSPTLQDLKKAQFYLNSKIDDLEKEQTP